MDEFKQKVLDYLDKKYPHEDIVFSSSSFDFGSQIGFEVRLGKYLRNAVRIPIQIKVSDAVYGPVQYRPIPISLSALSVVLEYPNGYKLEDGILYSAYQPILKSAQYKDNPITVEEASQPLIDWIEAVHKAGKLIEECKGVDEDES